MNNAGMSDNIIDDAQAASPAIRESVIRELIDKASTMHNDYALDGDGTLQRYNYDTSQFEPWDLYSWLVDQLPENDQ